MNAVLSLVNPSRGELKNLVSEAYTRTESKEASAVVLGVAKSAAGAFFVKPTPVPDVPVPRLVWGP
jgi:hypothetical protein